MTADFQQKVKISLTLTFWPFPVALQTILKMSNKLCNSAQLTDLISAVKYAIVQL